jgi:hypothetical protein
MQRQSKRVQRVGRNVHEFLHCHGHGQRGRGSASREPLRHSCGNGSIACDESAAVFAVSGSAPWLYAGFAMPCVSQGFGRALRYGRKERSAALPSGEGEAALLGVLAG